MSSKQVVAVCFVSLLTQLVCGDFQIEKEGFVFIYHSHTNLWLTIHGNDCYFTKIEDGIEDFLEGHYKQLVEDQLKMAILSGNSTRIINSSLTEVRNTFTDILADYRCANKSIFRLPLDTSGQYVYLERNVGQPGQVAELVSPELSLTEPVCLKFRYYLSGHADLGKLSVFARNFQGPVEQEQKLWELSGEQGHGWHKAEVTVRPPEDVLLGWRTQIILRATTGDYAEGDIGIDNVASSSGMCLASHLDCDFERNLCEWTQGYRDHHMDWKRHQGETSTGGTGPHKDHTVTSGDGHYLYMEANDGHPSDTADLQSPRLHITSPLCLKFWYYMHGADISSLEVYTKGTHTAEVLTWSKSGNQGEMWRQALVGIIPVSQTDRTQIIIRATRGNSVVSDIAIDDITGSTGNCVSVS